MTYRDALEYLYRLRTRGVRLELDRVRAALAHAGNPDSSLRFVHVAGTNGKGSVSAMLASMLQAGGHRTGLFTSPHLHRLTERIQIDGHPIAEAEVVRAVAQLAAEPASSPLHNLTFFETSFLIALQSFRAAACDIVVLETGMGGRLDATNVVQPEVCVITSIDLDHQTFLGATYAEIAHEKAGIIKPNVPLIAAVDHADARGVVQSQAEALGVAPQWFGTHITVVGGSNAHTFDVRVGDRVVRGLHLALHGMHQRVNAALAVAAAIELDRRGFTLDDDAMRRGLHDARWPARLELIDGHPQVLIDGAHNPHGCRALAAFLSERSAPHEARVLVFGCASDKDAAAMLDALGDSWAARIYVQPPVDRGLSPEALQQHRPGTVAPSVIAALDEATRRAGTHGLVVVAGSLFLAGAARALILDLPHDPPIAL